MSFFGKIGEFDSSVEEFDLYVERLELFFETNEIKSEKKVTMLLQQIGPKAYKIVKSLVHPELPKTKTYAALVGLLKSHYTPVKLVMVECFNFNRRNQSDGESVNNYAVELQRLASSCDFGPYLDRALRDRFVCGVVDDEIRKALLNCDDKLTFSKACQVARGLESARCHSQVLHAGEAVKKVEKTHRREKTQLPEPGSSKARHSKSEAGSRNKCRRCGRDHQEATCPAKNWACFSCNEKGHISSMCRRRKRIKQVQESQSESQSESDESLSEGSSTGSGEEFVLKKVSRVGRVDKTNPLRLDMRVNDKVLNMEVDSGSPYSIISHVTYNKWFSEVMLHPLKDKLSSICGTRLKTLGQIPVTVSNQRLLLVVIKDEEFSPLLGRAWLDKLFPAWRKQIGKMNQVVVKSLLASDHVNKTKEKAQENNVAVQSLQVADPGNEIKEFQRKYPQVFRKNSSGVIKGFEADVVLKEGATPIFHKPYGVPYALVDSVSQELKSLVEKGVLEPVKHSKWASPLVVVRKKDKGIRLCVDYKATVNRFTETEHYPLPKLNDILASLSDCTWFTVLDLSNAYQQLQISEKSKSVLTVNTHQGLYQFTRLPYGVSSAPAIFQAVLDQVLIGIPHVSCYLDDILIAERSKEGNKKLVETVLERLEEFNIRVNLDKCKFFSQSVEYLGHYIDQTGIHPKADKVEAIVNAPAPENVKQLQAFLGLLNFYNRFLPNLSTELKPLHKLLEKNVHWNWSTDCSKAFERSKVLLLSNQVLVPYDPTKPMIVACDASNYGVGAVLSHIIGGEEKPVMFISSTLIPAERGYPQVEKEALAIVFAVKRFHKYLYGHKFTLITDHLPLKALLGSKKNIPTLAAERLQRWAIILSAYVYEIQYRKGSEMGNADALSRLPLPTSTGESQYQYATVKQVIGQMTAYSGEGPCTARDIAKFTATDRVLSRVLTLTQQGWPEKVSEPALQPFLSRRHELSIDENCVTWASRVIIPERLRQQVLTLLHDQHPGIVRMKMLARSYVWWPGIDKDIERVSLECEECQIVNAGPQKVPLTNWPSPHKCWQRLHLDFAKKGGTMLLILVDSFSKWLEVWIMSVTTADKVIEKLRGVISVFGIPECLVTDNGPPFASVEFSAFCKENCINLMHSPPYHPPSNGLAERSVRTVKEVLSKYEINVDRLYRSQNLTLQHRVDNFLFHFRNTPSTVTKLSPAEIILKVKPRTKLGLLKPNLGAVLQRNSTEITDKHHLKHYRTAKEFLVGELVLVKGVGPNGNWKKGEIKLRVSTVTYLVSIDGKIKLVHADHLKHSALEHFSDGGGFMEPTVTKQKTVEGYSESKGSPTKGASPHNINEKSPTKVASPRRVIEANVQPEIVQPETAELMEPRRSGRSRKAPVRLDV